MSARDNAPSSQAGSKIKELFLTIGRFILGSVIGRGCCSTRGTKVKTERETALQQMNRR